MSKKIYAMNNLTDTNQVERIEPDEILEDLIYDTPNSYGYPPDFDPDFAKAKKNLKAVIRTEKQKAVSENEKIREMLNDPEVIGKAAKGAIKAQRKMAGLESEEN